MTTCVVVKPWGTLEADCLVRALRQAGMVVSDRRTPMTQACVIASPRGAMLEQLPGHDLEALPTLLVVDGLLPGPLGRDLGAAGLVTWGTEVPALVEAVRSVASGRSVAEHDRLPEQDPCHGMTDRELDVLSLVARADRDQEIAAQLGISVNTVRTHLQHAMMKLGVNHRHAVAAIAGRSPLLTSRLASAAPGRRAEHRR